MKTSARVVFGAVTFDDTDIKSAKVVEEFNPISDTLPINTFELVLYSANADFSILNPSGIYATLKNKQPLVVYEICGINTVLIGQYFLDTWENISATQIRFTCSDLLGMLDTVIYDGGIWLSAISIGDLVKSILNSIDIDCEIDPDLYDTPVKGWIPICSYREALQQIAFASGAYITCARQPGIIKIGRSYLSGIINRGVRSGVASSGQSYVRGYRWRPTLWNSLTPSYATDKGMYCGVVSCGQSHVRGQRWRPGTWKMLADDIVITKAEKGADQSITLRPRVTGVELTTHDYVAGSESMELYNGTLTTGVYKITFTQPMHTLSVTGTATLTITESGANYAIITVTVSGTVVLAGLLYVDTNSTIGVFATMDTGAKLKVLTVQDAYLANSTNGAEITQRVFDYYQQRYQQKVKLYAPAASPGSVVIVDTLYNQQIRGVVEKMSIDLAMGYVVQTEIVGVIS
jgi:hypothetical protein